MGISITASVLSVSPSVKAYADMLRDALPTHGTVDASFALDATDKDDQAWTVEIDAIDAKIEKLSAVDHDQVNEAESTRVRRELSDAISMKRTLLDAAFGYNVSKNGVLKPMTNSFLYRVCAAIDLLNGDVSYRGTDWLYLKVDAEIRIASITRKAKSAKGKRVAVQDAEAILSTYRKARIEATTV